MYRMIIADDEFTIRNGLSTIINWRELGFEVVGRFEDGKDVIEYLKNHTVDVVFTDVEMYEITGLEVAKWISQNRPETVVVIISGYREFTYVREALTSQVYDYILKPLNPEEIREVFERIRKKLDAEKKPRRMFSEELEEAQQLLLPEHMVERAKEYIRLHLSEELSVEVIAESVCLSRSHFAREFKRLVGESVLDYVIKERMERAVTMIREGESSPQKIATAVGYSDPKYFQRSFKKYTGYGIKEYQRLLQC